MTLESHQRQRLEFLCRVTQKEVNHLLDTDRRLFADLFTLEVAQQLETDAFLAERLGWIQSPDSWLTIRKLRNPMDHACIEDLGLLTGAL